MHNLTPNQINRIHQINGNLCLAVILIVGLITTISYLHWLRVPPTETTLYRTYRSTIIIGCIVLVCTTFAFLLIG